MHHLHLHTESEHILLITAGLTVGVSSQPIENLRAVTNCVCSNDIVIYECIVCGGFATVWKGSAFDRDCLEITLIHSHFHSGAPEVSGVCNNGRIVARVISVDGGCYISSLNIMFDAGLQNSTVMCISDNGTHTREIGSDVLLANTGTSV